MTYILIYLIIGVVLSLSVAVYAFITRRALYFEPKRTSLVFLVLIPLGWPYILWMIAQDLVSKKF